MPSMRFSTRSRRLDNSDRAVGDRDAIDAERVGVGLVRGRRRRTCEAEAGLTEPERSRSNGTFSTGRLITSSVICG